jgi:multidrug resistance protein MdtO
MERTTALIAQSLCGESFRVHWLLPAAAPTAPVSVSFVSALRNTEHFKFAVRGTLSAFLCYLFYMSTGWMGLGASILTCTLTALAVNGRQQAQTGSPICRLHLGGRSYRIRDRGVHSSSAQHDCGVRSVIRVGRLDRFLGSDFRPSDSISGFQIVLAYSLVNLN